MENPNFDCFKKFKDPVTGADLGPERCPYISRAVVCDDCGSPNFNVGGVSISNNIVSGRRDDCGGIKGQRVKTDKK